MGIVSSGLVRAEAPRRALIRCSLTDHLVRALPATFVFFFERTLDPAALQRSLAKVLGPFHPFNGVMRLSGGDLHIDGNDGGVGFSVARRDVTLRQVLDRMEDEGTRLADIMDTRRDVKVAQPVLTVRVTHFADGATSLGLCMHHCVGDMHSFMLLVRAWAAAHEGTPFEEPLAPVDRDAFLGERLAPDNGAPPMARYLGGLELARLLFFLATSARRKRWLHFYFGEEELAALRAHYGEKAGTWLSPSDALSAHVYAVATRCDPRQRTRQLSLAVNYRKRMGLPEGVLGNFITSLDTTCPPERAPESIAGEIREGLAAFRERRANIHPTIRLMRERGGTKAAGRFVASALDPIRGNLFITNLTDFGVYDVRFGGAAPVLFAPVGAVPLPWLSAMYEGFGGRGRIWRFSAPTEVADRLCEPAAIAEMHRLRPEGAVLPEEVRRTPWLH